MKRSSWLFAVAGFVLGAGAVGIPWGVTAAHQASEDDYQACLIAHGYTGGDVTDEQIDQIAQDCL